VYYDELARQERDVILTITPGKFVPKKTGKEIAVPLDCVVRTRWQNADVDWNGRTVIL
jgi:hypothetical protein